MFIFGTSLIATIILALFLVRFYRNKKWILVEDSDPPEYQVAERYLFGMSFCTGAILGIFVGILINQTAEIISSFTTFGVVLIPILFWLITYEDIERPSRSFSMLGIGFIVGIVFVQALFDLCINPIC